MLPSRPKSPDQALYSPRPAAANRRTQPLVAGDSPSPSPSSSPGSESPAGRWVEFATDADFAEQEPSLMANPSRQENGVVVFG